MIKAVIFDCFGVLITDVLKVIRDELYRQDIEAALEVDQLVRAANLGLIDPRESNERVAEILGMTYDAYRAKIDDGEVRNTPLFDYILQLRKTHKTAMLSNISSHSLDKRFTEEELAVYFDAVVVSGEVGFAKPSPEIYEIAADRLGVRCDECVFIDDREVFVAAATAVGMKGIVYTDFVQFQQELSALLGQKAA
jgi:HAD superfamily hydrolase (TIGR01509 family)